MPDMVYIVRERDCSFVYQYCQLVLIPVKKANYQEVWLRFHFSSHPLIGEAIPKLGQQLAS